MQGSPVRKIWNGERRSHETIALGRHGVGRETIDACDFSRGSRHYCPYTSPTAINNHRIQRAAQSSSLPDSHQGPSSSVRSAPLWFYSRTPPCTASYFPRSELTAEPLNPLLPLSLSNVRRPLCLCASVVGSVNRDSTLRRRDTENFPIQVHPCQIARRPIIVQLRLLLTTDTLNHLFSTNPHQGSVVLCASVVGSVHSGSPQRQRNTENF